MAHLLHAMETFTSRIKGGIGARTEQNYLRTLEKRQNRQDDFAIQVDSGGRRLKTAMLATKKRGIIAFEGAYHGSVAC